MDGHSNPPPPAAFLGSPAEEAEIDKRLAAVEAIEGRKARGRKWTGRLGWGVAGLLLVGNVAQSIVTASLFPLKEIRHQFTVLRDDGTSQALTSSWDLPPEKSEQLIQGTAVKYAVACGSWSWVHAKADYDFCQGMSAGGRSAEVSAMFDPTRNKEAPQNTFGQHGVVRIIPSGVRRVAPNSIRVHYTRIAQLPNERATMTRHLAVFDYVPVAELPANLRMMEPAADILFVRAQIDTDINPVELNPELAQPQGANR